MRRRWRWLLVLIAATGLVPAAEARAVQPTCGSTVTGRVVLQGDLVCPNEYGFVVGADGVEIDLNGFELTGFDIGTAIVVDGFDGVQVRNGTINGFGDGVSSVDSDGLRVSRVRFAEQRGSAIAVESGAGAVLARNQFVRSHVAVRMVYALESAISRNVVEQPWSSGVELIKSERNLVDRNAFVHGRGPDRGVVIDGGSSNNVKRNTFAGEFDSAVHLGSTESNVVARNRVANDPTGYCGIYLEMSKRNVIARNQVSGGGIRCAGIHVQAPDPSAVHTWPDENVIVRNRVESVMGDGFVLNGRRTQLSFNIASDAGGNGFRSQLGSGTEFVGNKASRNDGSGFYIDGSGNEDARTVVTENVAIANADGGIVAAFVARDGGGNVAYDNAGPLQCSAHIRCASRRPR